MILKEGLISVSSHSGRLSARRPTFLRTLQSVSPPRSLSAQLLLFPLSSLLHLSCHFSLSLFSLFSHFFFFFFFKTSRRVPPPALSFLHQCCPPASFLARLALIFPPDLSSLPLSLSLTGPVCLQKVQNDTERPLGVRTDQQHPVWDVQDASECWC